MPAKSITLTAEPRTIFGRKLKNLRRQQILPANIFGKNLDSIAVQLPLATFQTVFDQAGETSVIDLTVSGKPHPVLITNIHYDPVSGLPLHADFRQVDLTQKITANIPLEIVGQSPAVADLGGILETPLSEIEVEALPTDLPDHIDVDISTLAAIGDQLTVGDLKLSSNVTLQTDPSTPVVVISEPKAEEEPEVEPAEAGESQPQDQTDAPATETEAKTD